MRLSPLLLTLALSACMVGPDFTRPDAPAQTGYRAPNEANTDRIALGAATDSQWWHAYGSADLDRVVEQALRDNKTLAEANATLGQTQEAVEASSGALWPQLGLDASAGRQKYGKTLFGPSNFSIPPFTYYSVGPSVSYLLDIFGGNRREVERNAALAEYQGYQLQAAQLSLSAETVGQSLALASARAQIESIKQIIADDEENVRLTEATRAAGSGTLTDVLSAQSQLASDRALLPAIEQDLSVTRHALALLVGKAPADWQPPEFELSALTMPEKIPLSLPPELVHRRPDILAAEAQLHAASAAIGVATANLYPSLRLSANLTQQALTPAKLFEGNSNAWALAAGLTAPIFSGGTLSAEKRAAVDAYRAALARYEQTVLESFTQIADLLEALTHDAEQIEAQKHALNTADQALKLTRLSFQAGNVGVVQVLDAERQVSQARLGLTRAQTQHFADSARLFAASGGAPLAKASATE